MKPDRTNYEIWLIDWLEGNLSGQQTEELMAFLDENPDIREEVDSLSLTRLSSSDISYTGKENLKKSNTDLLPSQIEYLSAGYLENDLSPEQVTDLKQNIEKNDKNRIIFESIRKTKLSPPLIHYRNKSRLKKLTAGQIIVRFSAIGLSAAAAIAFLMLNYVFSPRHIQENSGFMATAIITDTAYIKAGIALTVKMNNGPSEKVLKVKSISNPIVALADNNINQFAISDFTDSLALMKEIPGPEAVTLANYKDIRFVKETDNSSLIAWTGNLTGIYNDNDDERSGLDKFISRTFRKRLLKEKTDDASPLKPYEIAEAGIEGLNKLLGWDMALVKTNDESGELKSVYFSSKILKFNAPVKKTSEVQ